MKKVYVLAAGLASLAVVLITLQYIVTADRRYDQQTENDLTVIADAIQNKHQGQSVPETDLTKLDLDSRVLERAAERRYEVKVVPYDPQVSGRSIKLELCAVFKTDTTEQYRYQTVKSHTAGFDCTQQSVYSDIY